MAKMTKEALEQIKQLFNEQYYIERDGVIYKQRTSSIFRITINHNKYKLSMKKLISYLNNPIDRNNIKLHNDILDVILSKFEDGIFTLCNNKIYEAILSRHQRGYINFWIKINGVEYRTFAHRIIYYLHYNIWDDSKVINHKDSNKSNNHIDNLELISQFENVLYSLQHHEILIPPRFLDEHTKLKYQLNDKQWEKFKKVAHESYNQYLQINERR